MVSKVDDHKGLVLEAPPALFQKAIGSFDISVSERLAQVNSTLPVNGSESFDEERDHDNLNGSDCATTTASEQDVVQSPYGRYKTRPLIEIDDFAAGDDFESECQYFVPGTPEPGTPEWTPRYPSLPVPQMLINSSQTTATSIGGVTANSIAPPATSSDPAWYRVSFLGGLELRSAPNFNASRTGFVLCHNEIFSVIQQVQCSDGRVFLLLRDGRGWAFDDASLMPTDPSVVRGHWASSSAPSSPMQEAPQLQTGPFSGTPNKTTQIPTPLANHFTLPLHSYEQSEEAHWQRKACAVQPLQINVQDRCLLAHSSKCLPRTVTHPQQAHVASCMNQASESSSMTIQTSYSNRGNDLHHWHPPSTACSSDHVQSCSEKQRPLSTHPPSIFDGFSASGQWYARAATATDATCCYSDPQFMSTSYMQTGFESQQGVDWQGSNSGSTFTQLGAFHGCCATMHNSFHTQSYEICPPMWHA